MVVHKSEPVKSTITTIPFVKDNNLDYKQLVAFCGKYKYAAGWILFVIMTTIVVTAVSNGSNLNDGMDGMCAGNAAIIGIALGILAYVSSNVGYASYFDIMYVPGSQELVIFICAFVGALIGFLWYNAYPAQIFMGDTGSLAIGGIIGVTAVIIHKELLIPVLCFVFFMESVSVLLQVRVAKYGNKRGKKLRLFKRAPIHDAFRVLPGQLAPDHIQLAARMLARVEDNDKILDYHNPHGCTRHHNAEDKIKRKKPQRRICGRQKAHGHTLAIRATRN